MILLTLKAFFSPKRLLKWAENNEYTPLHGDIGKYKNNTLNRINTFRYEQFKALIIIFVVAIAGILTSHIVCRYLPHLYEYRFYFQLVSILIIAYAVLGRVGWSIQTMDGNSIVEKINIFWFRFLYITGAWLAVSSFWVNNINKCF